MNKASIPTDKCAIEMRTVGEAFSKLESEVADINRAVHRLVSMLGFFSRNSKAFSEANDAIFSNAEIVGMLNSPTGDTSVAQARLLAMVNNLAFLRDAVHKVADNLDM